MDASADRSPLSSSGAELNIELQNVLNAVTEGVCGLDASGNAKFCNQALLRLTGYTAKEIVGRNLHKLLRQHSKEEANGRENRWALQGRVDQSLSLPDELLRRKDGTCFPAQCWVRTLQSTVACAVLTVRDLTEIRRTEDVLVQSAQTFRRILSNAPDVAWTSDRQGRTVYISPKVEALFGYSRDEIYGAGDHLRMGCIHPADFGRVHQAYEALFEQQISFHEEYRFRRKDGTWIWVQDRATSTHEENGICFADGFLCEISSRKQMETELRFHTAFLEAQANSTIDGILVVDPHGKKLFRNRRLAELFNLPAEASDSNSDTKVLQDLVALTKNPELFQSTIHHLNRHPHETTRDEMELKNGMFLDRYSSPVVDQKAIYYGRIWIFRDVTTRKRNEDALQQLSLAVEQSPVSVLITDPQGNISYVNRKFTDCTGYAREEVAGKNPRILNSGSSPPELFRDLWTTITSGKVWRGEMCNKKKSGEIFWEAASITPMTNPQGVITHFLAVKEDITERRALETQLRQAQKLEGIGHLAAGIAHEINTPTQFVTDNLTFLRDSWKSVYTLLQQYRSAIHEAADGSTATILLSLHEAEQSCDLEFIGDEVPRAIDQSLDGARRVATIVRAMKEFSHPDSAEKTATDLNRAIASTITVARNEWKYVSDVVTDFEESLPAVVCYPGDINQVVLNLIVNAAHAIKEKLKDDEKGQITVRTRAQGEFVQICISDTGGGIPAPIQGKVFDPFFTTKEVGKGTGQGLALAHSVVVKKHGGKIWFETELGKGTSFFVLLPVKVTAAAHAS